MEDLLPEVDMTQIPYTIAELLREHKGGDALVLDLRPMNTWTDFFVIATATSDTHLDGLERHIKELCTEQGIAILRRSRKPATSKATTLSGASVSGVQEDEWRIIDLGPTVIHLMSSRAREFYDLERLYSMTQMNL